DSWMSRDSRRTLWSPGITQAPLPTTILNPRPAASPSGPWWARSPEMINASFGSATLKKNMTRLLAPALREPADDDRARGVVPDDDNPGSLRNLLCRVGRVGEVRLRAASDGNHHLAHASRRNRSDDAPHLPDHLMVR